MRFRPILRRLLALSLAWGVVACQYEETNRSLDEITEVTLADLLPTALTQVAYNQSAFSGRASAILMQQLDEVDFSRPISRYFLPPSYFDEPWNDGFYAGSLQLAATIRDMARENGSPVYEAIAHILLAHEWGRLAALFGDVPFSESLQGNAYLQPRYDRQELVYEGVVALLDEAIRLLADANGGPGPGADDLLFGGDAERWGRLAYALKARFLLHTAKRRPPHFSEILDIVRHRTFTGTSEQANFDWSRVQTMNQPLYSFGVERNNTVVIHDTLAQHLLATDDPRADRLMAPGFQGEWFYYQEGNEQLYWAQPDAVIPMVSWVEIKFMEAEALLRTGAATSDIEQALYEAIAGSFEQMNLAPSAHADFIAERASLDGYTSGEAILEHLMREAWVAYFGFGFQQVWHNYRRTGYPILSPAPDGLQHNYNPSGSIPLRFIYPETERLYNAANTAEAMDRQAGARLDVPVWAFE